MNGKDVFEMIFLISGASHTGKTLLAQRLMEEIKYPYLSLDLLKMGLIRSKQTELTPIDDEKMTGFLWPIVSEIIKTAIENQQNLIIEGCYIPFDWANSFEDWYRRHIRCYYLAMSEPYIHNHFADMKQYANVIETRLDDSDFSIEYAKRENARFISGCREHDCRCFMIENYTADMDRILETMEKELDNE